MDISEIFDFPDVKTWSNIRTRYDEDPDRVDQQIREFKNWLRHEPDFPEEVDEHLVRTLIRYKECNLDEVKLTFQRYLESRTTLNAYLRNHELNEKYFRNMIHRIIIFTKNLTPEGYRGVIIKLPRNIDQLDVEETMHYFSLIADLALFRDSCAGYVSIYDLQNISVGQISKVDMELFTEFMKIAYNIEPFRIVQVHFLNVPEIPKEILGLLETTVKKEFINRVHVHTNFSTLKEYLPENIIPKEYGGSLDNLEDLAEMMKVYLQENVNVKKKCIDLISE